MDNREALATLGTQDTGRRQYDMLWEQTSTLWEQIYFLWEQNNKLLEQDIILREKNKTNMLA